ncbi:MAG: hypothetical protein PVG99_11675 [Desulfobacteraceae bacterium]|jgi:hypothetical protein
MGQSNCGLKFLVSIFFIALNLWAVPQSIYAKDNPNTITFDNQSGEDALVKLIGPTKRAVKVSNGETQTVNVAAGKYYILTRYGRNPEKYRYSKGDSFSVTQTATQYSAITITLHKVMGGNYPTHKISGKDFDNARVTSQEAAPRLGATKPVLPHPKIPSPPAKIDLPKINVPPPKIDLSQIRVPPPKIDLPKISLPPPKINLPNIKSPPVKVPPSPKKVQDGRKSEPIVSESKTTTLSKENPNTVSGPNWGLKLLAVENTGKRRWEKASFKLGSTSYIRINEDDLSFWRVRAEVRRKKHGLDFSSDWIQLIYTTHKGGKSRKTAAASIISWMGDSAAASGSFTIEFNNPDLSTPTKLDLLFLAPKNSNDVDYMAVQLLDYPKVQVTPK